MNQRVAKSMRVLIVGGGMSGLCMAIRLKQAGYENLTILESGDEVGGTWYKNSYPNAGCDIPSYLYCFSFAPNDQWSMKYARQPEILAYFRDCVRRFSLQQHIRFGTTVQAAEFDEATSTWRITTAKGETLTADILVSAVGQLNQPAVPSIPGLESYTGASWHSARWNHGFDFSGKTVAVVGNGASAVQFIPEVARKANRTIVFQRSPSWIHPLNNYRYPAWARWSLCHLPLAAKLHRWWIYWTCDLRVFAFRKDSVLNREYGRWLRSRMRKQIPPDHWSRLIPDYAPGCKRVLLSSDYLQTLCRDDVELVTESIAQVEGNSVVTSSGKHAVDAVIFATGFRANDFLQPMAIRGRGGVSLQDAWDGRPKAFAGVAVSGFPNFFMLYGPNTNLGHNSIIVMVERQVRYIVKMIRWLEKSRSKSIEVKRSVMQAYDRKTQQQLKSSIWATDCTNWYKSADGSIPNNWSGSATSYWLRMWRLKPSDFELSR